VVLAYKLWRSNPAAVRDGSAAPLSLQVENRADQLLVGWDPASRMAIGARRGRLSVRDGPFSGSLELTADQVRSGKLFYLRSTNQVELHLELEEQDGRRVGESVIFMAAAAPAAAGPSAGRRPPGAQRSGRDDRGAGNPAQARASQPDASVVPRPSANRADDLSARIIAPPPAARSAPFVPPVATRTEQSRFLDAPPPIADREAAARAPVLPGNMPVQLQPPKPASPPQPPAPKEQQVSANPPPSYAATLPEPIRQVAPVISPSTRQVMHGRADVRIRVSIDVTGKVTQASVTSKSGPMAAVLADAALKAAYQWQFKPAFANGHPLPSEKILQFTFTGK
jgi:TonB family protein